MLKKSLAAAVIITTVTLGAASCSQLSLAGTQGKIMSESNVTQDSHSASLKASVSQIENAGKSAIQSGGSLADVVSEFNSSADGIAATAISESVVTVRGHKSMTLDNVYTITFTDSGASTSVSTSP